MTYGWPGGSSRRWRKLRARKLQSDPLCEPCRRQRKVVEATEVHHITPISAGGGKFALANLESRCADCHIRAHGGRPKGGVDPKTGLPIGDDHWWNTQ